jgi:hypothetical protein
MIQIYPTYGVQDQAASYDKSKEGCCQFRRGVAGQDRSIDDECAVRIIRRAMRFRSHRFPARDNFPAHEARAFGDERARPGFDRKDTGLAGAAWTKVAKAG